MKEKWVVTAKRADFDNWAKEYQISPVLARIIRNRDVTEAEEVQKFLHGNMEDCYSPWLLQGMEQAVAAILQAIRERVPIRVIGDYDVDGICSAYILTRGLQQLGATVDTAVPHRIHDGYGLNNNLLEEAAADGIRFIVTCDNGIAAAEQIEHAKELGIEVVVTDHHEVPYEEVDGERREVLPKALAIVDPKQASCHYPFPNICGGVVAYKLVQALVERSLKNSDGLFSDDVCAEEAYTEEACSGVAYSEKVYANRAFAERGCANGAGMDKVCTEGACTEGACTNRTSQGEVSTLGDCMEELLEFAAFATVCDVMELRDENRILVKEGLKLMRNTRNLGLRALIEVNDISLEKLSAYHLGFVFGPCMNATGRLDTADRALKLLMSKDKVEAMTQARALKEMNDSRKNLTLQGVHKAEQYIAEHNLTENKVFVVYLPEVHESLAGIIAGRIREKYYHPVFVLTKSEEGVKGSGRSIDTYHMYDSMTAVKHLFTKYGGHKLAAGLSMEEQDIPALQKALNDNCTLTKEDFVPVVHIDVPMPLSYATEELARQLDTLEPYGVGNPKPLFAEKNLIFLTGTKRGANKNVARFGVKTEDGLRRELVFFGDLERFGAFLNEKYGEHSEQRLYAGEGEFPVSVTYQLGLNSYRGKVSLQFIMQNYC